MSKSSYLDSNIFHALSRIVKCTEAGKYLLLQPLPVGEGLLRLHALAHQEVNFGPLCLVEDPVRGRPLTIKS